MPSLVLNNVSLSFGANRILEAVNLTITEKSRIALYGANGSGKSTLFRIMSQQMTPDTGQVILQRDTRLSYLPQSGIALSDCTVKEEAEKAYDEIIPLIAEQKKLEQILGTMTEESTETAELIEKHHKIQERIQNSEYYMRDREISKVLTGLGFSLEDFSRPVSTFSGGWQMRIALAKVLLERPDILLLDEPTNYLDIEARTWLETFLADFKGGFIIVSHDRFFLDVTVNQVLEIYLRKITSYKGNYSQYEDKRAGELVSTIEAYNRQQEEISKIETFIKRFQYNSSKAKLVQSRIRYLEKLPRIEKPPGMRKINFTFPKPPHCGEIAVEVTDLCKAYDTNVVLDKVNFQLDRGEKLVLVGPNGAGKSTLMGILAGTLTADSGTVRYGKDVGIGYFSQDDIDSYRSTAAVIEEMETASPVELIPQLRNLLGTFLFSGDDIYKSYAVLSGGEKNRIALLKLLMHPANLLLLDEPTNHLDMVSKDILLNALQSYSGSLVFVSHDRYFIEKLATRVLEIDKTAGVIKLYPGDYTYYLWKKAQQESNPEAVPGKTGKEADNEKPEKIQARLTREEEKKRKNLENKLKNREKELLTRIEQTDIAYKELEVSMSLEENYQDGLKMKQIKDEMSMNRAGNDALLKEWEEVCLQLEELASRG